MFLRAICISILFACSLGFYPVLNERFIDSSSVIKLSPTEEGHLQRLKLGDIKRGGGGRGGGGRGGGGGSNSGSNGGRGGGGGSNSGSSGGSGNSGGKGGWAGGLNSFGEKGTPYGGPRGYPMYGNNYALPYWQQYGYTRPAPRPAGIYPYMFLPMPFLHPLLGSNRSHPTANHTQLTVERGISLLKSDPHGQTNMVDVTVHENTFPLILDTASAYIWFYGEDCRSKACEGRMKLEYETLQGNYSKFALNYKDGAASGLIRSTKLKISNMTIDTEFNIGIATEVPDIFAPYNSSGVLGLPATSYSAFNSFVTGLFDANSISSKAFSIYIGDMDTIFKDVNATGVFSLGPPLDQLYLGNITYTKVINSSNDYWLIMVSSSFVGDELINFTVPMPLALNSTISRASVVDSGTTLLVMPKKDATDLHSKFEGAITDGTNFAIFCNSTKEITLEINDRFWPIPAESYVGEPYSESSPFWGYCVSNIQGADNIDSWILGKVFLENYYSVFNALEGTVGFAIKNNNVQLVLPTTSTAAIQTTSTVSTTSSATGGGFTNNLANFNRVDLSCFTFFLFLLSLIL